MTTEKTEFFNCACGTPDHILSVSIDMGDDPYLCLQMQMSSYTPFHKRIWQAIKHVLGHHNAIEWDTTLIEDKKDVERLYLLIKELHDET